MRVAVLPSSLFTMRSYTPWSPSIDHYAFYSSSAAPLRARVFDLAHKHPLGLVL